MTSRCCCTTSKCRGFTLPEIVVSLLGVSLVVLGVTALFMPLKHLVIRQLAWSELGQQGRMATMLLRHLGRGAVVIDGTDTMVMLDGVKDVRCPVLIRSRRRPLGEAGEKKTAVLASHEVPHQGAHYGLFVKMAYDPAQEWVRGVEIVKIRYVLNITKSPWTQYCASDITNWHQVQGLEFDLHCHSRFGNTQPWRVFVLLRSTTSK